MEMIRVWVVPLLLVAGAGWLALQEVQHLLAEAGHRPWLRFFRRLAGAAILLGVAVMVHEGETSTPNPVSRDEAIRLFHYWMTVLGLVLMAMFLALWDVMDGLRRLGSYLEEVERDEVQALQDRLKERKS